MAAPSNFQKQSIPPSQLSPDDGALATTQPVFSWTPVEGARRYRLQIAQEPTFASPLEDVATASTSYTPLATYPADTTLYWRVRADDENLIGLNWSGVRTLQRKLPTPTTDPSNPTIGDFTPAWKWSNVTGSSGYTFSMDGPTGDHREWSGVRVPSVAFVYIFGPGIWRWRVRADFPKYPSGTVSGPGPGTYRSRGRSASRAAPTRASPETTSSSPGTGSSARPTTGCRSRRPRTSRPRSRT